ncbi:unnamed protein product [Adineta steineri]|uniref:Deoxynucleoside kinase domain-containing protein n=1 Tax=Adineta steineri TaxID=433720 RepID=A0A814RZN0_9BILA|nr:unnamed protein product [Adineta steineri]CAF1491128.1 unnamed protein product [Adineta steineri]
MLRNENCCSSVISDAFSKDLPTTKINTLDERRSYFFDREHNNIESHQLIFLDINLNNTTQYTIPFLLEEFRKIVNYTKFINDNEEAVQFIEQTNDTTTFLICSNCSNQSIIPQIHILRHIRSIYIYCQEEHEHQQCPQEYSKTRCDVYNDSQLLLKDLKYDIEKYLQQAKDGIFSEVGKDNYSTNIFTFSWWNYVISMICHLTYPDNCLETFLIKLRHYYQDRQSELKILDEFERTYTSNTAIYWYTRNTFFFHLLNRALRQKNIEVIFLFSFFIKDMYMQLKNEHEKFQATYSDIEMVEVYRGQIMSSDEIYELTKDTDFITTSFFSTTLDHTLASFLTESLGTQDDQWKRVLFEIQVDSRFKTHPFGDIASLSYFPNESEVLFMIGARFKVIECYHNDDTGLYVVKLKLEDESSLRQEYNVIGITARATLKNCINEIIHHLYKVSLEDVHSLFIELQELFPLEKSWLDAVKYFVIARIYQQFHIKHYPEYVQNTLDKLKQALNIYQSFINDKELTCAVDIGRICSSLGFVYDIYVKDNILANNYYDLGITSCTLSLQTTTDKHKRIELYDIIGSLSQNRVTITDDETQRKEILLDCITYRKQQLEELLNYLPENHSDLLNCIHSLAELQNAVGLVTETTMNYEKVIQIYLQQDEPSFSSSAENYGKISKMYAEQKQNYTQALHYKQKEVECRIKYRAVPTNSIVLIASINSDLAETYRELADFYIQLSEYELADESLLISMQLKSTMLSRLGQSPSYDIIHEPLEKWKNCYGENLLAQFYKEPSRWAFLFEINALRTLAELYVEPSKELIKIHERSIHSTRHCFIENLFENGTLTNVEYQILDDDFKRLTDNNSCKVDLILYLRTEPEVCLKRIRARNRPEEAKIDLDYLRALHRQHEQWLTSKIYHDRAMLPRVITIDANQDEEQVYEDIDTHMIDFISQ